MNLISKQSVSIAISAIAFSVAPVVTQAAHALTISAGPLPTKTGVSLIDFNALPVQTVPTAPAPPIELGDGITLSDGVIGNRITVITDEATPPVGDTGNYLKVRQTNATFSFDQPLKYFGFLWGSIDAGNTVQFFGSGGTKTFTGSSLFGGSLLPFPENLEADGTRYVEFSLADIGADVNKVVFSTNLSPFEVDNVAYQVPTPALLPGLIGLGLGLLRKRKALSA